MTDEAKRAKQNERSRAWRQAHPDKVKAYRQTHREQYIAYMREYMKKWRAKRKGTPKPEAVTQTQTQDVTASPKPSNEGTPALEQPTV